MAKTYAGRGRTIPAPAKPAGTRGTEGGVGLSVREQERRREQRVMLRVKIQIHVALQGKATTFEASTTSVSPGGALVVLAQALPVDTRLVLEHRGTRERVACKVMRPAREMPEGFHTALEFDSPTHDFWKIAFPPADWRAEDV